MAIFAFAEAMKYLWGEVGNENSFHTKSGFQACMLLGLYVNLPTIKVKGHMVVMAQENQHSGGDSRTRTRSQIHISITECSTK